MLPVLWATAMPLGSPAGIASLNFWRSGSRPSRRRPVRSTACPVAIFCSSTASAARRRRVVQSLVERLLILDAAQHEHAVGAEPVDRRLMFSAPNRSISRFAAKLLLTVIIASHSCRSVMRLADRLVDLRVGVVARPRADRRCRPRCCETRCGSASGSSSESCPASRLTEQLDHDRHLHRARRVERLVGVDAASRPGRRASRIATATSAPLLATIVVARSRSAHPHRRECGEGHATRSSESMHGHRTQRVSFNDGSRDRCRGTRSSSRARGWRA